MKPEPDPTSENQSRPTPNFYVLGERIQLLEMLFVT
jgi:hypothetical protein